MAVLDDDILTKLRGAWDEDHKMNLMHYCDLAAQEIERLRAAVRPFAAVVFNDNGAVTFDYSHLRNADYLRAKRAMRA